MGYERTKLMSFIKFRLEKLDSAEKTRKIASNQFIYKMRAFLINFFAKILIETNRSLIALFIPKYCNKPLLFYHTLNNVYKFKSSWVFPYREKIVFF